MNELSNKALSLFLLAAIVVSLGGTLVVLNKLGTMHPTGFAASATGTVNLTVASTKSITTNESNLINFGSCTTAGSYFDVINSENTLNTSTRCPSLDSTYRNISVRNDGNANGSITVAFSACAPGGGNASCAFLNSSGSPKSTLQFRTTSSGRPPYTGGCSNTPITAYTIVNGTHPVAACTQLDAGASANSLVLNVQIGLSPSTYLVTNTQNTVTFAIA